MSAVDGLWLTPETAADFVPAELVAGPDTEGRTWLS